MSDLKPETIEKVRAAYRAVKEAVFALANDDRHPVEGGSICPDGYGGNEYIRASLTVRPAWVADISDDYRREAYANA